MYPTTRRCLEMSLITGIQWLLIVVSILSPRSFIMGNTIVSTSSSKLDDRLGQVQKVLRLPIASLAACVSANLIRYTPLINLVSRSKIHGLLNAKRLHLSCAAFFEAGSALCGAAPILNALIVGLVLADFNCRTLNDLDKTSSETKPRAMDAESG